MRIHQSPGLFLASLEALHAGLQTSLPSGSAQLSADGKDTPLGDLQTEIQGYVDAYQAAEDTAAAHTKALQAREALAARAAARFAVLAGALKTTIGKRSPDLTKYGLKPDRVPAPLTSAEMQARVAKARATRIARGTKGKRQREAITGVVPIAAAPAASPVTNAAASIGHWRDTR